MQQGYWVNDIDDGTDAGHNCHQELTILLFGSTGFIGSGVLQYLTNHFMVNHVMVDGQVCYPNTNPYVKNSNIKKDRQGYSKPTLNLRLPNHHEVDFNADVEKDFDKNVTNPQLDLWFRGVDVVINTVGIMSFDKQKMERVHYINISIL